MAEAHSSGMAGGLGGGGDDYPDRGRDNSSRGDSGDGAMKTPTKENSKKPKRGKEGAAAASGEEWSSASTAVTTALSPMTVGSLSAGSQNQQMDVEVRRDQLQSQVFFLSLATMTTLAMFVMTVVPMTIIIAFGMFATSAGLLSYTSFQRLVLEFQEIVAGDGFAQFLPASLMQQLTETSLHEFMRDDTFVREWGFLAIYFVPGLTEDQLNAYIRRMAPDRQAMVNRRGMGHFISDSLMRVMVGERRWRQESIVANVPTIEHPNNQEQIVVRSRGLDLDFDTDSQASAPVGLTVPAENQSNPPPNDEERRRQQAQEGDLIMTAVWDGLNNYVNAATVAASQFAVDQVLAPMRGVAATVGLVSSVGVTVLSLGAGIWNHSRPASSTGQQSSRALSGFLLSTTIVGGLSTGVMLYARSAIRNSAKPPNRKPPPK